MSTVEPSLVEQPTTVHHVIAMPFPGRGHINPMMNLCKLLLSSKEPNLLITFVVTEEWLGYIGSDPKPENIRFATMPNGFVPPERLKAVDFPGFYEAAMTKMEAPFEQLLDRIQPPVRAILGDVELPWVIGVGNRRNITVASLWTMPATFFSMLHHFHFFTRSRNLLLDLSKYSDFTRSRNLPLDLKIDQDKHVDHIPGLSSAQVADLQTIFHENDLRVLQLAMECIATVSNSQHLLFTSSYELEPQAIDSLNAIFPFPVYPIGPAVPFLELEDNSSARSHDNPSYLQWLDSQPAGSVLYISLGSFLSVSGAQMDEIAAGLRDNGVRFLWVARGDSSSQLKERCGGMGIVLPWCEQLRVLCHSSIGGFWSHCGWNSTLDAAFAGVPMLTFPLFLDQVANSRLIVEEWRIGWRIKRSEAGNHDDILVTKEEISELVRRFMNLESGEVKELRERARGLKDSCHQAIAEGGSSHTNLDAFIRGISQSHG